MAPLETLRDALFQPRRVFGSLSPGPFGPALRLTTLFLFPPSLAAILTDDAFWAGNMGPAAARGLGWWILGVFWLLGPQAALFSLVMRMFGARAPLSLAQRGMAAFSALLCVFGSLMSIAGINPESAPYVISWYLTLILMTVLGTYALYQFATGAYQLNTGKGIGSVLTFEVVHGIAFVVALGGFFAATAP